MPINRTKPNARLESESGFTKTTERNIDNKYGHPKEAITMNPTIEYGEHPSAPISSAINEKPVRLESPQDKPPSHSASQTKP